LCAATRIWKRKLKIGKRNQISLCIMEREEQQTGNRFENNKQEKDSPTH
jgi:hypothetical protein